RQTGRGVLRLPEHQRAGAELRLRDIERGRRRAVVEIRRRDDRWRGLRRRRIFEDVLRRLARNDPGSRRAHQADGCVSREVTAVGVNSKTPGLRDGYTKPGVLGQQKKPQWPASSPTELSGAI